MTTWLPPDYPTRLAREDAKLSGVETWLRRAGYASREAAALAPEVLELVRLRLREGEERDAAAAAARGLLAGRAPATVAALPRGPASTLSPTELAARLRSLGREGDVETAVDVLSGERWVLVDYGDDRQTNTAVLVSALFRLLELGALPLRRVAWSSGVAGAYPDLRALYPAREADLDAWDEEVAADLFLDYRGGRSSIRGRRFGPIGDEPPVYRTGLAFALGYQGRDTRARELGVSVAYPRGLEGRAREVLERVARLSDAAIDRALVYAGLEDADDLRALLRSRRDAARDVVGG